LFLATFGVFAVRHPGSVRATLTTVHGLGMIAAAVVVIAMFVYASRFRPKIQPFVPFVLAAGIVGGAVYAEVPFERTSVQNRTLVATPVPAARAVAGELHGINHEASGRVSIVESATGERVVRFEDFHVQGAPAPVLYVTDGADVQSPGGTNLGAFRATDGQRLDVALPAGVRPGADWTVLIWCERFATPIANATLSTQ
jgi:hypothetical protein